MGTPHTHPAPIRIELTSGDFFVIASDGILSIREGNTGTRVEEALLSLINTDMVNFAYLAIKAANRYFEEFINGRVTGRFGGSDNVSALLIYPEKLIDVDFQESFILGGHITEQR